MRTKLDTAAFERIVSDMDELREQWPWDKNKLGKCVL
jgi:hypothetical protein